MFGLVSVRLSQFPPLTEGVEKKRKKKKRSSQFFGQNTLYSDHKLSLYIDIKPCLNFNSNSFMMNLLATLISLAAATTTALSIPLPDTPDREVSQHLISMPFGLGAWSKCHSCSTAEHTSRSGTKNPRRQHSDCDGFFFHVGRGDTVCLSQPTPGRSNTFRDPYSSLSKHTASIREAGQYIANQLMSNPSPSASAVPFQHPFCVMSACPLILLLQLNSKCKSGPSQAKISSK